MNTFNKLSMHLINHVYTKGNYKGDAPVDRSRRGRVNHRVAKQSDCMVVIMHSTKILRAYEDGSFMLDTCGWYDSPTTKQGVYEALKFTPLIGRHIYSKKVFGKSQHCITLLDGRVVKYHDGMRFDANGVLTTPLVPFERYQINKQESKQFAADIKESGFKAMFPLLYVLCKAPDSGLTFLPNSNSIHEIVATDYRAPAWPEIIEFFKFTTVYDYKTQTHVCMERGDAKSCWAAIMKVCKARMYETVTTTVSAL